MPSHLPYKASCPKSGQSGLKKLQTIKPSSKIPYAEPSNNREPMPFFQRIFNSLTIMAPLPYSDTIITKPNGLKNSSGGAEPESSSPIAGDNKKRARAGEGFDSFMASHLNWPIGARGKDRLI